MKPRNDNYKLGSRTRAIAPQPELPTSKSTLSGATPKNMDKPIFSKKQPAFVMNLKQSQNQETDKQVPSIISCRSNPNLLSFNNYIKIDSCQQDKIALYVKNIKSSSSIGQSKEVAKTGKLKQAKKPSQINNFKQTDMHKGHRKQRFIRKSLDSNIDDDFRLHTQSMVSIEKKDGLQILRNQVKKKTKQCETYQDQIQNLKNNNIAMKLENKKLKVELLEKNKKILQGNQRVKQLEKQLKLLLEEQAKLKETIEQLNNEENNLLKNLSFHQSEFCPDPDQNTSSILPFDMTETAEYIENISHLEDEISRKDTELFNLKKKFEDLKIKQHCDQIKHQDELLQIQNQWKQKFMLLIQKYKECKSSLESMKTSKLYDEKAYSTKMRKDKQRVLDECLTDKEEDQFNLSITIQ